MNEDRNQHQIIRKDARNCFVESLNDAFKIGKIHLAFATYDLSRPTGQRQTNNIHIYIAVDEFLELCRKLEGGELRYLLKNKKTTGDKTPLYQCLGGTSARSLQNTDVPVQMGKVCPEQHSYWQEANQISCLWRIAGPAKQIRKA